MTKSHIGMVTLFVIAVASLSGCGTDAEEEAIEAVRAHERASIAKDLEAVLETFAADATVMGHPLDPDGGTAQGHDEIRPLEEESLGFALDEAGFEYLDLEATGNVVNFDRLLHTPTNCFRGSHRVTVENGKITRWEWTDQDQPCA